jgi:hypothetical protein
MDRVGNDLVATRLSIRLAYQSERSELFSLFLVAEKLKEPPLQSRLERISRGAPIYLKREKNLTLRNTRVLLGNEIPTCSMAS